MMKKEKLHSQLCKYKELFKYSLVKIYITKLIIKMCLRYMVATDITISC